MERSSKKGLDPGSLVYVGPNKTHAARIDIWHYDENGAIHESPVHGFDWNHWSPQREKTWIEVSGIHQKEIIEKIGIQFGIDPLVQEDIMNVHGRPKLDDYDAFQFICIKAMDVRVVEPFRMEQFSLIIKKNLIISFQEEEGDCFESIRERLMKPKSKICNYSTHYLAYSLLDSIVDDYLKISETFGKRIEIIESMLTKNTKETHFKTLLQIRKELLDFKRSIDPTREVIHLLAKDDQLETKKYFVDLYDHILFVSDNLHFHRELLSNSLELYHALSNHKTNQVMRLLTMITTIFVPLTFIVGVYGMNFEHLPELHWKYGYGAVWAFMVLLIILQLWWFKKNRWIGK